MIHFILLSGIAQFLGSTGYAKYVKINGGHAPTRSGIDH